jgi:hypothetical protein
MMRLPSGPAAPRSSPPTRASFAQPTSRFLERPLATRMGMLLHG